MRTALPVKAGLCLALVSATFFIGCCVPFGGTFKAKASRTSELSVPLAGLTALECDTEVGAIRLRAEAVTEARITADITVRAKTQEEAAELAEQVQVTAEPSGQTLVIRIVKPAGFGRNKLGVDFTIVAPPQLDLDCATNVGDIATDGFTNSVKARTDVGSITCTGLRNATDVHTNVGDVRLVYAPDAPPAVSVSATTNVGSVDFTGPSEISANLTAAANVGSIDTDRPLRVTGPIKKSITASLGSAEGTIKLRTNVGSIKIR